MRRRKEILVCDDDRGTRLILRRILEREHDVTVVEAPTGRDALRLLASSRFTLLILDLGMPGVDGFDTLDAIRSSAALQDLPVVVLTADGRAESVAQVLSHGVTAFLLKPLNSVRTRERLGALMAKLDDLATPKGAHLG
jgi:CheY-like chemotaxis protein